MFNQSFKVVSGGQTGVDRAALDWAISHKISYEGWCPKGRLAEDGTIDLSYNLREAPSEDYSQRTEWNVRDSDGTVIFSIVKALSEGTLLTAKLADKYGKPYLHLYKETTNDDHATQLLAFIRDYRIEVLNVAGPRASMEPEVYVFVTQVLNQTLLLT